MAQPDTSTHVDHADEALAQIAAARRELDNWENHLRRLIESHNYGVALQAENSGQIAVCTLGGALTLTRRALERLAPTSEGGNPARDWLIVAEHGRHFHPGAGLKTGGILCHDHDGFGYHCHDKHHFDTAAYNPTTE